jgi:serine/threonine-protein kinase
MTQIALPSIGDSALVPVIRPDNSSAWVREWELVELAGEGSLAKVYRARAITGPTDCPPAYAVKMLRPEWQDDHDAIGVLQREALAGAHVSHPHIVPLLAAHVLDAPRLLVMPWLEGATLQARLAAGERFETSKALWMARQVAEALGGFHRVGWMHGDVTPGNIHLSPSGHVTLLDLSFARPHEETGSAVDRPIMGTCNYIAPEQLTSALRSDIRSDIYSLGAVVFEVFSGRAPYQARDLADLATQQRQSAAPDLFRLAPHLPREVFALVRQMLAKDPLRRPQSPHELLSRLIALEIATFNERA